jgi:hypothetical protein
MKIKRDDEKNSKGLGENKCWILKKIILFFYFFYVCLENHCLKVIGKKEVVFLLNFLIKQHYTPFVPLKRGVDSLLKAALREGGIPLLTISYTQQH